MQLITVHLYDPEVASAYVHALSGGERPDWSWWQSDLTEVFASEMDENAASRIGVGLVRAMADAYPSYHENGFGLTPWEAQFDRGIGMYMRPPARIFVDNGISPMVTGKMPIRLDLQGGIMAGAWIPPHLIANLDQLIDTRLEIWAKRIHEAEIDPYPMLAMMRMVCDDALRNSLGLIEAINVIEPGMRVIETPDKKRMNAGIRARIDAALKEDQQSLIDKLFRRGR